MPWVLPSGAGGTSWPRSRWPSVHALIQPFREGARAIADLPPSAFLPAQQLYQLLRQDGAQFELPAQPGVFKLYDSFLEKAHEVAS